MENLLLLGVPKIWAHYSLITCIMCLNIGTPYNHHFPFGTNGKVVVLGVSILEHFRVVKFTNRVDPDEVAHYELPHLHLHCSPIVLEFSV